MFHGPSPNLKGGGEMRNPIEKEIGELVKIRCASACCTRQSLKHKPSLVDPGELTTVTALGSVRKARKVPRAYHRFAGQTAILARYHVTGPELQILERDFSGSMMRPEEYIAILVLMRGIGDRGQQASLEDLQAATESLLDAIRFARVRHKAKRTPHLPSTRAVLPAVPCDSVTSDSF